MFLERILYENSVQQWLISLLSILVFFSALIVLKRIVYRQVYAFAQKTTTEWDDLVADLIQRTMWPFLLVVAAYIGILPLTFTRNATTAIGKVVLIAFLVQSAIWGSYLLNFWLAQYKKRKLDTNAAAVTTFVSLGFVGQLILWSVVGLLILDNLGIDITALVAGLGVTGIAVALAVQNILGDLFASLSIVLDKPFVIGDFVIIDTFLGTIEKIGLKTTRIRSLWGEQLVFSNSDLLSSRIRNFKRMYERRVVFTLGVTYQTPYPKLRRIPGMLNDVIETHDKVRFDRAHFKEYGEYAFVFEIVYWIHDPDYNLYMDIQQAINFDILWRFQQQGIQVAYPTQTLHLQRNSGMGATLPQEGASQPSFQIVPKSAYEPPDPQDGARILISGFWPPGLKKEEAHIDQWMQALAPSRELREWFQHDGDTWPEFKQRYFEELRTNQKSVEAVLALASQQKVTLVFGTKEQEYNAARALKSYVENLMLNERQGRPDEDKTTA